MQNNTFPKYINFVIYIHSHAVQVSIAVQLAVAQQLSSNVQHIFQATTGSTFCNIVCHGSHSE